MTSDTQRRRALERANEVRSRRATIKRGIAEGRYDVAELVDGEALPDIQRYADEIPIGQLLEAMPGVGPGTAEELLETPALREPPEAAIPSDRPLHRLTPRTRRELAARIRQEAR